MTLVKKSQEPSSDARSSSKEDDQECSIALMLDQMKTSAEGMPMDSSELAELDAAVALALGWTAKEVCDPDGIVNDGRPFINYVNDNGAGHCRPDEWSPSTDWSQGGPIIERERIEVVPWAVRGMWSAFINTGPDRKILDGPTPLVAAMRAFVASKK